MLGFANVAIDQKLTRREIVAQLAGDDTHFAWLDDNVGDKLTLPPNGAIEISGLAPLVGGRRRSRDLCSVAAGCTNRLVSKVDAGAVFSR